MYGVDMLALLAAADFTDYRILSNRDEHC